MVEVRQQADDFKHLMPIFATEGFLRSRSDEYGWFVDNNYVLPFIVDKKLIFRRMVFTNEPIPRGDVSLEKEQRFLDRVIDVVKEDRLVDFIAKPQSNAVFRVVPKNSEYVEWGSYVIDLNQAEEEIFRKFQPRYRSKIRSAARKGATVERTNDVGMVYRLIHHTFARQGEFLYPSKHYLTCLKENLGTNCAFYVAKFNGVVQGCLVVPNNTLGGQYYYGGSIPRPLNGSLNLLHYRAMLELKREDVPSYDLMGARMQVVPGSKIAGIQAFKERFGPQLRRGYAFKYVVNPLKYRLFDRTVRLYYLARGSRYTGDPIDQIKALASSS